MKPQHEIEHERYLIFLEGLNDDDTAQAFFDKKVAQSKELIAQLLMAVDGRKTSKGNQAIEWAAVNLLEIFETFQIRHDNFERENFADELKDYLYTWTLEYGDYKNEWARRVFAERGLDIHGLEIETPIPESSSGSPNELQPLAQQISDLMQNPHLPPKLYSVIGDEIAIVDHAHTPENVLFNLKKLSEVENES